MPDVHIAPYGAWRSPLSAALIAAGATGLRGAPLHIAGAAAYWVESRPAEGGRNVIMRCPLEATAPGQAQDVTPAPFNVRSRVHEYGGAAYIVADDTLYFVNFVDQRIYRQSLDAAPTPITAEADVRYGDLVFDRVRNRLICVREDHREAGREPINALVAVPLDGGEAQALIAGADFYSTPRLSPDGATLAWLSWNHPNMPWDGTELWQATLGADGSLAGAEQIAGGPEESIFQPHWSPDGVLYFVSDRTGWWNLYRWRDAQAEPLHPMEAEFGAAQWTLGAATYGFASPTQLVCAVQQHGQQRLAQIDVTRGELSWLDTPYTEITLPTAESGQVVFLGGSPTEALALVRLDLAAGALSVLHRSQAAAIDPGYLSSPESITFPTEHDQVAYGLFYPPQNRDMRAPVDERPPLLVISHGGPTSAANTTLSLSIQYWTSRGFGVLDVNYGGSTGYGRAYRQRLNGQWGVVDVADCVNGARYLAQRGDVDGARLAIRGGSAGGYTTLCALTFYDLFRAGASHFGVSDLEALARDTHKFESRYLDRLVGPYPAARAIYRERSPIHFTERLSCPLILFQGLEDKVVPPNQSELMRDALRSKGLPVIYVTFEGEGHGFRKAENIIRALETELSFYAQVFGFTPADPIEPVEVEHLAAWLQRAAD